MAYFFSIFNGDFSSVEQFEDIFSDLIPSNREITSQHIKNSDTYLKNYSPQKGINDILIKHNSSDSWLLLVGCPLAQIDSDKEKQQLLEKFLDNPKRSLRSDIDGNFAALSYDANKREFIAATDFNSTIAINYSITSNNIIVSSSELGLAKLLGSEVTPFGFAQTVGIGTIWGSLTRFKNIYKLLPCEIVTFDENKKVYKEKYWQPSEESLWPNNFNDVMDKWGLLLKKAIQKYYVQSGRDEVFTCFTAGEDARLIVACLHALGIPFYAHVSGFPDDVDVLVGCAAANQAGFDLTVEPRYMIDKNLLLKEAVKISIQTDAYHQFFLSCNMFAKENKDINKHKQNCVDFMGVPGGAVFRGQYYLRGRVLFPSKSMNFNYRFFIKLKFLLDYKPGLLSYPDTEFLERIYGGASDILKEVEKFPAGIKIDHILRCYQTCQMGCKDKIPMYLPMATRDMTRSIYCIPPHYKSGGKLTKACTENMFPELALTKTQHGVPTIRKTLTRLPLFIPEYYSKYKKIKNGFANRLLRLKQSTSSLQDCNRLDFNTPIFISLFNNQPYDEWFQSSKTMLTGDFYNSSQLDPILREAQNGNCKYIGLLSKIIDQELACRWVYDKI